MTAFPNVDIANKWAKQVVLDKIPACKWVKLACERHLNDLKKSKNKDFPYRFDSRLAEKKLLLLNCFLIQRVNGQ